MESDLGIENTEMEISCLLFDRYKIKLKMLSRVLSSAVRSAKTNNMLFKAAQRGVYTDATRPHVFINEHTKLLV